MLNPDRHLFQCYIYKACKHGFFGDNCSSKCPAMYFGPGCTSQCNSTKDQCHPVTGCLQSPSKVHVELFHLIITDTF